MEETILEQKNEIKRMQGVIELGKHLKKRREENETNFWTRIEILEYKMEYLQEK